METVLTIPQDLLLGAIALLDAMPDGARAALAAGFLVLLLRPFEARIPSFEIQYGQSFRKTALIALVLIPAFVWLVPASRMTVYVEELGPPDPGVHPFWLGLLSVWLLGLLATLAAFIRAELKTQAEMRSLALVEDDKLITRMRHWQRRLGVEAEIKLVEITGIEPKFFASTELVAFPAAAQHWPGNQQDVLLIVSLVHLKRRHRRWHRLGGLVSCIYWPVPWVQALADHLILDFQKAADRLAESCYQDRLGYDRALRQLAQRLEAPARGAAGSTEQSEPGLPAKLAAAWQRYSNALRNLLDPATEPAWRLTDLLSERSSDNQLSWTDPYDRVVLFVGQAVFLAFLLTGTTLEERPPEIDYEYSFPFELLWKEHFHRNLELQEKAQPPPPS